MDDEEEIAPQPPPSRFPCWVVAKYSWGGEHARDLGFMEGDLIECLNAGDGHWWTGRSRRDRRTIGMFPSNFVRVLPPTFVPSSRGSSPAPDRTPSVSPTPTKSKPFRKPFQAYSAPDPAVQKRAELRQQERVSVSPMPSPRPSSRATYLRNTSPPRFNRYNGSRASSPNPFVDRVGVPPPSFPSPRAESPSGIFSCDATCGSPLPPPPPPHRSTFDTYPSVGYQGHQDRFSHGYSRPATPEQHIPERTGHTPSPLTHAINDVISSLEDMGTDSMNSQHDLPSQANLDPWDPGVYATRQSVHRPPSGLDVRPNTSTGIDIDRDYDLSRNRPRHKRSRADFHENPPQPHYHAGRMDRGMEQSAVDEPPQVPPKHSFFRPKSPFTRSKSPYSRSRSPDMLIPLPSQSRPKSSMGDHAPPLPVLRQRKSAYEVGKSLIGRTFTNKSASTNASSGVQSISTNTTSSTQATDKSLMSGKSAGQYSATSAGSYARKQAEKYGRAQSAMGSRKDDISRRHGSQPEVDGARPETPFTGITYHNSHASDQSRSKSSAGWRGGDDITPKPKKSGFFKRMVESAKTGAANARSTIGTSETPRPTKNIGNGSSFGVQYKDVDDAARDIGLGTNPGVDWVRVRQDINRANSLSRHERADRKDRCLMTDYPAMEPITQLYELMEGDEGGDGRHVEQPRNFQSSTLALVDKNVRFVHSLPPMINPISLTTGYVCRPYRNDVQRLRAIFTWCAEKLIWEDEFEGDVDVLRLILTKRGGTEEVVFLVLEMCQAVGIPCNVIRGYLKSPGEALTDDKFPHPNHFWNSVLVENEWRIMDCSLASPSHPKRHLYSTHAPGDKAETWYCLTRPSEICWTHVPCHDDDQHLVPSIEPQILLHLPCVTPQYFRKGLQLVNYDTSLYRIEDLEIVHIKFSVPNDVECAAEVEALTMSQDDDGDRYETDNIAKISALTQARWVGGEKQYTVKALMPPNSSPPAILKVYAGPRGLMSSARIPHPLAFTLPIVHRGSGDDGYEFVARYCTPHAARYDLYIMQPQCRRLVVGNTFVFTVRQHPAAPHAFDDAPSEASGRDGGRSPGPDVNLPVLRPSSAMSNNTFTTASHSSSAGPTGKAFRVAKLAIQSPGGKILRLSKKEEPRAGKAGHAHHDEAAPDGLVYETIIKCGERGIWRACVLADKTSRWCVFGEWTCI